MLQLAFTAFAGGVLIGLAIVGLVHIITNAHEARRYRHGRY